MSTARRGSAKPLPCSDAESSRMVLDLVETRIPLSPTEAKRHAPDWGEVALLAIDGGEPGIEHALKAVEARDPEQAARFRAALDEARTNPDTITFPSPPDTAKPFTLGVLGTAEFASKRYPREYLVTKLLVAKRPAIFAGPKKSLKTSLLVELVVSLSGGVTFLNEFMVPRRLKTLIISGESGEATIQETLRRVCKARGMDPDFLEGFAHWGFRLPQLGSLEQVDALAAYIRENGIEVVIIDPVYLCLVGAGPKIDPANLFDVGPLLKRVADTCLEAGATPILAHHFRKNRENPYDPPDMEDIAFAGFQEFARQWVLVGRRAAYEPGSGEHNLWVTIGGSDGQSGGWAVDIREGIADEDFHDREWDVTVHHAAEAREEAKAKAEAARASVQAQKEKAKEDRKETDDRKAMETALEAFSAAPGRKLTVTALRTATGWRKDKVDHILFRLVTAKVLVCDTITVKGGNGATKDYPGFRLSEGVSE